MSQTEPFVMVPVSVLDAGLTPQAYMIYSALRRHADNDTLATYVGRERLAGYLGLKKVASVDRYTRELVEAGLIEVSDRWCSKVDRRDWVATKDAAHTIQGSNLYTITAGQAGSLLGDSGGPVEGTQGVPQKGHELDPLNYTQTTRAKNTRSAEPTAKVLPVDWEPNAQHRAEAVKLGINLDAVAAKFGAGMAASGERRKNWGSTFMAYLRAEVDNRAEVTFTAVDADAAEAATAAIVDAEFRALQAATTAQAVPAAVIEAEAEAVVDAVSVPAVTEVSEYREVEAALAARPWMRDNAELVSLAESLAVEGCGRYPIMRALDDADAAARRAGRVA